MLPARARRAVLALCAAPLLAVGAVQAQSGAPVRLATTTSTENSGLLKALLPAFEARCGCKVQVISVGSGKAIKLGEDGNVDVLLVHARAAEDAYMAAGHGTVRRDVMANDFLLVGPAADPAGVRGGKDVIEALRRIAATQARFVSRGDDSGTDQMEKGYWSLTGSNPKGRPWYASAGVGMGEVLTMAGQMGAYTLTDRATYASYRARTGLEVLVEGDPKMFNPYGIMNVNPAKSPAINREGALALIEWITSPQGQRAIAAFRVEGQQLFFPASK